MVLREDESLRKAIQAEERTKLEKEMEEKVEREKQQLKAKFRREENGNPELKQLQMNAIDNRAEIEQLRRKLEQAEQEKKDCEAMIQQKDKEIETHKRTYEARENEWRNMFDQTMEAFDEEVHSRDAELVIAKRHLEQAANDIEVLMDQNQKLTARLEEASLI